MARQRGEARAEVLQQQTLLRRLTALATCNTLIFLNVLLLYYGHRGMPGLMVNMLSVLGAQCSIWTLFYFVQLLPGIGKLIFFRFRGDKGATKYSENTLAIQSICMYIDVIVNAKL